MYPTSYDFFYVVNRNIRWNSVQFLGIPRSSILSNFFLFDDAFGDAYEATLGGVEIFKSLCGLLYKLEDNFDAKK